jgi:hypothetical protein
MYFAPTDNKAYIISSDPNNTIVVLLPERSKKYDDEAIRARAIRSLFFFNMFTMRTPKEKAAVYGGVAKGNSETRHH